MGNNNSIGCSKRKKIVTDIFPSLENRCKKFTAKFNFGALLDKRTMLAFLPGAFLVGVGLAVMLAPTLFVAILATFFVFCGLTVSFLSWKLLVFARRIEKLAKQFEARVYIQGVDIKQQQQRREPDAQAEEKKIVYH